MHKGNILKPHKIFDFVYVRIIRLIHVIALLADEKLYIAYPSQQIWRIRVASLLLQCKEPNYSFSSFSKTSVRELKILTTSWLN